MSFVTYLEKTDRDISESYCILNIFPEELSWARQLFLLRHKALWLAKIYSGSARLSDKGWFLQHSHVCWNPTTHVLEGSVILAMIGSHNLKSSIALHTQIVMNDDVKYGMICSGFYQLRSVKRGKHRASSQYQHMLYVFDLQTLQHYNDIIMGAIASKITSLTIVYSTVYSGADQRKHQSSASLAFVRGIHRRPVNSPHKWPVTRKMFPFDDVIMRLCFTAMSRAFKYSCHITLELIVKWVIEK